MAFFTDIDNKLKSWVEAQIIDRSTAEKIRQFESESSRGSDILVRLALALGGIMVTAGVLLFVAAHWDALSPSQRFLMVLVLTAGFHVAGAFFAEKMRTLSVTLHALGTAALGAGIFLAGQIFNLQEHWPGGIMLWAIGAVAAWYILRHSVQGVFCALLIPSWLAGEWIVRAGDRLGTALILAVFVAMLSLSYLTIPDQMLREGLSKSLHALGGVVFIPASIVAIILAGETTHYGLHRVGPALMISGWILAIALPLLFAIGMRRAGSLYNLVAAAWLIAVTQFDYRNDLAQLTIYVLCALASVGMIGWGIREAQKNYINVGVIGFALTIAFFYFSSVMDKLGRSFALISGGILFLVGGYFLEKVRRRLVQRLAINGGAA